MSATETATVAPRCDCVLHACVCERPSKQKYEMCHECQHGRHIGVGETAFVEHVETARSIFRRSTISGAVLAVVSAGSDINRAVRWEINGACRDGDGRQFEYAISVREVTP